MKKFPYIDTKRTHRLPVHADPDWTKPAYAKSIRAAPIRAKPLRVVPVRAEPHGSQPEMLGSWQQGYLTVYIALSMMVMLSLCLTLVEGIRRSTIRMELECVMDIGLNSILAEYHRELLNQYNLFFIDTSYGTGTPSYYNTEEHLQEYIERNLSMEKIFLSEYRYRDFLAMEVTDTQITKISVATDEKGSVLRRQAVEAVKDDIGISFLEEVKQWLGKVEGYGLDKRNIQEEKAKIDHTIQGYDGMEKQISETEWKRVDIQNPTERLDGTRSTGILELVFEDTAALSRRTADLSGTVSGRIKQGILNDGNFSENAPDNPADFLLFQEYLLRYCGYYGKELEKGQLKYQIEYLVAGKDSDIENLKSVVYRISAIREAANAAYLFSDQAKCAQAQALATALAAAMLVPEIAPILKVSLLLGWAYAESLYDMKVMLLGGKIPLLKNSETWHYEIDCIFQEAEDKVTPGTETGLSYGDYLRILLGLADQEIRTFRFLDVVEMDIRQTPGNSSFRADGCIDKVEAEVFIQSGYGYSYSITRGKGYRMLG
ncbi:MAG: DUF5702 domain-containing protein [Clostridium sp.]|nr:DUF5702 domain-containing protein [Clostridium sp.]